MATVGPRQPLNGRIHLEDDNADWPLHVAEVDAAIMQAPGSDAAQIQQIGSTSVAGLMAKPVIDVVLVVADSADQRLYL